MKWTSRLPGVRGAGALGLHLFMIGILVLPWPAIPATITVNDPSGIVAVDGLCSLPEAIDNANDDLQVHADCTSGDSGLDTIDLTTHVLLTSSNNGGTDTGNGLPVVDSPIAITGNGYSVSRDAGATDLFRLFEVAVDGELTLDSVTVSGGSVSDPIDNSLGGGILNNGKLTLTQSTVSGNSVNASSSYPYGFGGGIYNAGSAYLYYSTVADNSVNADAFPASPFHIAGGGGIQNGDFLGKATGASLVIENSTISGNTLSAVADEYAQAYGGGLYAGSGAVTIVNSTLSSNDASANGPDLAYAIGGGTFITDATATLTSTTLSSNTLDAQSATLAVEGGAGIEFFPFMPPDLTIEDSVIGNHAGYDNCAGIGAMQDGGDNLADDGTCGSILATLSGLDATLADNTGPTLTHALLSGSTAIDNASTCVLTVDQRGLPRDDGTCDSGAFEFLGCAAPQGEEFVLDGGMTTSEDTYEACNSITVRNHMVLGPSGYLILRTAGSILFENEFVIGPDGRMTVEIDSMIMVPDRQ